jgi:hypothetical protein
MRIAWRVALVAVAACGGRAGSPADAGAPLTGAASFEVEAKLALSAAAGEWAAFPRAQTFTVFVDAQALRLVAGAHGYGAASGLARDAATGAFATDGVVAVRGPFSGSCDGVAEVEYDELEFEVVGRRLTGTGRGLARFVTGDIRWSAPMTAVLAGALDEAAPVVAPAAETIEPMGQSFFAASEPLGESAASLIGAEGDVFALGAEIYDGPPMFTTGFVRSPLMLNWGTTYEVTTEALVDLAGHAGMRASRPTVHTPPSPPVIAEDGFESATGGTFGGAAVVSAASRIEALAGTKSLAIGHGVGHPFLTVGPTFTARLAIQPGDTVVRFAARVATPFDAPAGFEGEVRVGVPGREVSVIKDVSATEVSPAPVSSGAPIYMGLLRTIEVPLPLGAVGEASVQIASRAVGCGSRYASALIIDDLRVE